MNELPKYYYNQADNKVIKLSEENKMIYYQIKKYDSGEIKHSYGRTHMPSKDRLDNELLNFIEVTKEKFEEVVKDYYATEKVNADRARQLFNSNL